MNRVKERNRLLWTEAHARRELEAWRRSGDSMAAYTCERGYSAQRLSWRKGRLEAAEQPVETTTLALVTAVITSVERPPVVVCRGG